MKAVLFDLDGTLLDTRDMILDSFRFAYRKVLGPDAIPPDNQLLELVGIPLRNQMKMIHPEKSEELFNAYIENNARVQKTMIKGFPNTAETLATLRQMGIRLSVVTSKRHDPAVFGLKSKGLYDYFEFIIGADDTTEHKPKPGPLLQTAELMKLQPEECSYLGDSPYDMLAARAADMLAIGALWGMFSQQELQKAGAQMMLSHIDELPQAVDSIMSV